MFIANQEQQLNQYKHLIICSPHSIVNNQELEQITIMYKNLMWTVCPTDALYLSLFKYWVGGVNGHINDPLKCKTTHV